MHRVVSALLLICFGVLAPWQALPTRLCLLENRLLLTGFDACGVSDRGKAKCCEKCEARDVKQTTGETGEECCVAWEALPDATVPPLPGKLPALAWVVLPVLESPWLPRLAVTKAETRPPPALIPITAAKRQAVLRVWTV